MSEDSQRKIDCKNCRMNGECLAKEIDKKEFNAALNMVKESEIERAKREYEKTGATVISGGVICELAFEKWLNGI